jgi:hypothetical protein
MSRHQVPPTCELSCVPRQLRTTSTMNEMAVNERKSISHNEMGVKMAGSFRHLTLVRDRAASGFCISAPPIPNPTPK